MPSSPGFLVRIFPPARAGIRAGENSGGGRTDGTDYNNRKEGEGMKDMKRVNVDGEEYVIARVNPMIGYPAHYLENATLKEKSEFYKNLHETMAQSLHEWMAMCGALEKTETVNENGDTFVGLEALVLVKARIWEEVVRGDPERNPPCTHDT